jgi:hypothetical protein
LLSLQRKKKKSLETGLWMAIWGCGSSAHCCQPAVAGGFIYADLRSKLSMHLGPAGFVYLECDCHWCKISPFQAHWGRWHCTHFLRPACLFTAHVGSGSSLFFIQIKNRWKRIWFSELKGNSFVKNGESDGFCFLSAKPQRFRRWFNDISKINIVEEWVILLKIFRNILEFQKN